MARDDRRPPIRPPTDLPIQRFEYDVTFGFSDTALDVFWAAVEELKKLNDVLRNPPITRGRLTIDRKGGNIMAQDPSLPTHVRAQWYKSGDPDGSPSGSPTSVDWMLSPPEAGTLTPDADAPTLGAGLAFASGYSGPFTVRGVAHQKTGADVSAEASDEVTPPIQDVIVRGVVTIDPQAASPAAGLRSRR